MNDYSPEFFNTEDVKTALTLDEIKDAIENDKILEFRVKGCTLNNTLIMEFSPALIGEIELDELEYNVFKEKTTEKKAMFKIGKHIKFKPISIEEHKDTTVVKCSRKAAQKECYENYISKLKPGDVIDAKIINFENYGVFCDIGCGIASLLPYGHVSVVNVPNPKQMLKDIPKLKVVVRTTVDRIVLSHRELLGTWEQEASKLKKDQIIHGVVIGKKDYGTFVKITQNISGLADSGKSLDNLEVGDCVAAQINKVNNDGMKVKLTILYKCDNEPDVNNDIHYYYNTGDHIDKWVYTNDTYKKVIGTDFGKTNHDMEEYFKKKGINE